MKKIDFDNLPVGTSIRFLKNWLAIPKDAYVSKKEKGDWYASDLGGDFSAILRFAVNEIDGIVKRDYGEIKVPSKEKYRVKIGDVFMFTNANPYPDTFGLIYTCELKDRGDFLFRTKDGREFGCCEDTLIDGINSNSLVIVDGPSMISLTACNIETEPKDNGTREICYWCHGETTPLNFGFGGSGARFCKRCKK